MVNPGIKKQILDDLKHLPFELQKRVQEFTHALQISQPKGTSGKDILKFSGIIDHDEAKRMERAIEAGCEKVDADEW